MLLTFYFHWRMFSLFGQRPNALCLYGLLDLREKAEEFLQDYGQKCHISMAIGRQKIWEEEKIGALMCSYALLNNLWSIANTGDERQRRTSWKCSLLIKAKFSKARKKTIKWVKWVSFIHLFICLFELNHRCGIFRLFKCSYFVLPGYSCLYHKPQTPSTHAISFVYFSGFHKRIENVGGWICILENIECYHNSSLNNQKHSLKCLHFSYCSSESDAIPWWLIVIAFRSIRVKTQKFPCKQ